MCDCINKVNSSLAKKGHELDLPKLPRRVQIVTRRKKVWSTPLNRSLIQVFATFCPFCGKPYDARLSK